MLISALWHGAAWHFVMWGAIHAAFYSFERLTDWSRYVRRIPWIGLGLALLVTNAVVMLAWVFFRAPDIGRGFEIVAAMLRLDQWAMPASAGQLLLLCALAIAFEAGLVAAERSVPLPALRPLRVAAVPLVGLLLAASILFRGPGSAFIYFQF
jgi:alginate O-acetyltransferase complex protein AlgI